MKDQTKETSEKSKDLPEPGPGKQDPKELDEQLDRALEDSMVASDPPATAMPEVHHRDGNGNDYDQEKKERQRTSS